MAYVSAKSVVDRGFHGSGTLSIDLPAHVQNDVVFALVTPEYGETISATPSGWTQEYANNNNSTYAYLYSYRAGATPKTTLDITFTNTNISHSVIIAVVKGAQTSGAYVDVKASRASAGAATLQCPSVTTTGTKRLILGFVGGGDSTNDFSNPISKTGVGHLGTAASDNNIWSHGFYTFQSSTGATGAFDLIYGEYQTTWNYNAYTIAIIDDGNDNNPTYCDISSDANRPSEILTRFSTNWESGALATTSWDPTTVFSTVNSRTTNNYSSNTRDQSIQSGIFNISMGPYVSPFPPGGDVFMGASDLATAADLTDDVILLTVNSDDTDPSPYEFDDPHLFVGFSDGTNGRLVALAGNDTTPSFLSSTVPNIFQPNATFSFEDSGTFDITNCDKVIFGMTVNNLAGFIHVCSGVHRLQFMRALGGSSARPGSFNELIPITENAQLKSIQFQQDQTVGQFYVLQSIQLGDGGTTDIYWDSSRQSVEYPSASDTTVSPKRIQAQIDSAALEFKVDAGTGKNIILNAMVFNMGDYHKFTITSGDVQGSATVVNSTPTIGTTDSALTGWVFSACKELTLTGDLSGGCTIDNCVDTNAITLTGATEAAIQSKLDDIANCSFNDNNTAIRIEYTGTGNISLDFTGITWSGNTTDIHYNSTSSSALTANCDTGSGASTTAVSGSATSVTIVLPTTEITVNSSEASTLIQIFTTGTQTVVSSTTGASLVFTYTGTPTYDICVQKAGFLPQRLTGQVMPGADVTFEFTLVDDPVYDASHGLTYTTDASWSRASNQLTVPTFGPSVRAVHSLMIDSFISETALRNTAYNIFMNGPNSMFLINDAEGASDSDIENMTAGGVRYVTTAGATAAEWAGVESIGTIPAGSTGEYQQVDGSGTTDARTTGKFDELIKTYGDASHGNFDYRGHLVLKFQVNGYYQVRSDVLSTYGISTLEPVLYVIALEPTLTGWATGDPAVSLTIVDHTSSPLVVGGKSFDYEIQDGGTISALNISRDINYNNSLDATYLGKDPFNWPDIAIQVGDDFETKYDLVEGVSGLHGFYISRSGGDHPDFLRFQSNDGTYYVPSVTVSIDIPNLIDGTRVYLYDETNTALLDNSVVSGGGGYSYSLAYTSDITISFKACYQSGTTAKLPITGTGIVTASGLTLLDTQEDDTIHNSLGIDGSTVTELTADFANIQIDVSDSDDTFDCRRGIAWWRYITQTSQGIADYNVLALEYNPDQYNIQVDGALQIENVKVGSVLKITDGLWTRKDGGDMIASTSETIHWIPNDRLYAFVDDEIENGENFSDQMKLVRSATVGKASVSGDTVTFRDAADTKDRITSTTDDEGQRTSVTTDST